MSEISTEHYPDNVDLDNCAKEPIHIMGKSQAYGVLLACDPETLRVKQTSDNSIEFLGISHQDLLQLSLKDLLEREALEKLQKKAASKEDLLPLEVEINSRKFVMAGHFSGSSLVLDLEPLREQNDQLFLQKQLTQILNGFRNSGSISEICSSAAELAKQIFRYDRVMVYRFDAAWNGEVIAEKKEKEMGSWLGLHYPATDIPAQSRAMFLKQPVRMIAHVNYEPVNIKPEISPLTGEPLDISRSALRAVSPIHIEYLQNMEVGASLTAAIVVNGRLWGLIACHHRTAKFVDHYQREGCRFLSQVLASELTLQENNNYIEKFESSEQTRKTLLEQMQRCESVVSGLLYEDLKFVDLFDCGGGAILEEEKWYFCGKVPEEEQVVSLFDKFLKHQQDNVFATTHLLSEFAEADAYKEVAAGVLSVRVSENRYVIWFKPEEVQTVTWGGNPQKKAFYNEEKKRLSPRKSFEKWTQALSGRSKAWEESDLKVVRNFREDINHITLANQRRAIEKLNKKLISANHELELFSYGLSHDLRAPVRGIQGYLQIIEEDQAAALNEDGRRMLRMTRDLTYRMNDLIDDILEYSRVNNTEDLQIKAVNTTDLIKEVLKSINVEASYPGTEILLAENFPYMHGDKRMLYQLWSNIINNALKYSAERENPVVEINFSEEKEGETVFHVRDNGIGIKEKFKEKIFETFSRVSGGNFKGSGIGLAVVKKIIEKHNGKIWVESKFGEGSAFFFYTSKRTKA